ncbi:MAG: hypothetical protein JSS20_20845, partial [Proteobacteria bacterium]|nr:hypothetical protein [Pseudomonadota bacterium]
MPHTTRRSHAAATAGVRPLVARNDPRYLDKAYWAQPRDGQNVLEARGEQVKAIKAHQAESRRSRRRRRIAYSPVERLGTPAHFPGLVPHRPF